MTDNLFLKPAEYYQRQINPLHQYVDQNSFYLSKMTGKPIDQCKSFITEGIKGKKFPLMNDPAVTYFERGMNGDREKYQGSLSGYISSTVSNGDIIAPTFTTYYPPTVKKSILVNFIDENVVVRSIAKKEAFKAKSEGNMERFIMKNNEQDNRKRYNNSMSGAFAAGGSIVNNPTGHSTLTSITRTLSSLANSSNEKIISGNRHYRNADVTLYNLISLTSSLDRDSFRATMEKYHFRCPTVQDVLNCVQYSTQLYWADPIAFKKIEDFVNKLDGLERAAIVYIGDFYHLRLHNPDFVRAFLTKLSLKVTGTDYEDPVAEMKKIDELVVNFAHQICMKEVKGIGKDYSKIPKEDLCTVVATCKNIEKVISDHKDLISSIFLTTNVPSSTAYIPNMLRRTVVLSDTDSTMFSIDEWVQWYFGELRFTDESFALAGSVMYIATQCIAHCLALFSANIGVERSKLFKAQMKPEMVFNVFCQTSVAKHYFTGLIVKEGNVAKEMEMEIKGVHLKNSAAPQALVKDSQAKMKEIVEKIASNQKISIREELKRVADIERKIKTSLLRGDVEFYKSAKIKNAEAYAKSAEESPYMHHVLWTDVFGPKYGVPEQPPYGVIKIPTSIRNKTDLKNWIDGITDRDLADRLMTWLTKMNKTTLGTMYVSSQYVRSYGIPTEIKTIIDFKRIILDLTTTDRMVLETLGWYAKPEWLISEMGY